MLQTALANTDTLSPQERHQRARPLDKFERAYADGVRADRRLFEREPWRIHGPSRPLPADELLALVKRRGTEPPPGVRMPKVYAVVATRIDRAEGLVTRRVFLVDQKQWSECARARYLELFTCEVGARVDFQCGGSFGVVVDKPVYTDTIPASEGGA